MPSMNVKVPVSKVIAALEKKLKELKTALGKEKQFRIDLEAWEKNVAGSVEASWKIQSSNVQTRWRSTKDTLEVIYEIPKALISQKPKEPTFLSHEARNGIDEIENALNILRMTEDETVNASTFKAVSKFL
jgi:hypothetical protein